MGVAIITIIIRVGYIAQISNFLHKWALSISKCRHLYITPRTVPVLLSKTPWLSPFSVLHASALTPELLGRESPRTGTAQCFVHLNLTCHFLYHFHWAWVLDLTKIPSCHCFTNQYMGDPLRISHPKNHTTIKHHWKVPPFSHVTFPCVSTAASEKGTRSRSPNTSLLSNHFSHLNSCAKLGQDLMFISFCIILEFPTLSY